MKFLGFSSLTAFSFLKLSECASMVDLSHSESDHDLYFPTISQAGLFRDGVQEYWSIKDLGQLKQL